MSMKPILFNTEMVRSILDGRKTVTRRVVKPQPITVLNISEEGVYYDNCGKWCGIEANTELAKQRLYGRGGREYLFEDAIRRFREEGIHGLVSVEGAQDKDGISFGFYLPQQPKENKECTQYDMRGISRGEAGERASEALRREPGEQHTDEFGVGNYSRELERQKASRIGHDWGAAPDVEIDKRGENGNHGIVQTRVEPKANCADLFRKSISYLEGIALPYSIGQTLYVRETWRKYNGQYYYKADELSDYDDYFTKKLPSAPKWCPSIRMPRSAARIFLRVTDVRVERLREMTYIDVWKEGLKYINEFTPHDVMKRFASLWDSTIKPADRDRYGWAANPWVWVIEFERCEKPKEGKGNG